ncbi:hypothetical protein KC678_02360 [Candidatus Dojkabacteria bacterium]|uniref:DDH domain-containing protein n=1 Tax=Candidatus Dojkabacteria bacterium TaxID=2099670 RepID=A0A955I9D4_9BACT|nr:hypothetical protein [Candidatus Dojkabacteria bacterium]
MIQDYSTYDIAQHIIGRIFNAQQILIVCSRPVDPDSLSSGLTVSWWIERHFKQTPDIVIFHSIPDKFTNYPNIESVKFKNIDDVNWKGYDLIILVDSSAWEMLLTDKYESVLAQTGFEPFVLIDHHKQNIIHSDLRHNSLRLDEVCTGKIIYDYFIKPSTENLTEDISTLLYYGLIDDARYFKNEPYDGMYSYAEELLDQKARHSEVMNTNVSKESMEFLAWAIENTQFYPEIETTFLVIDDEKDEELINKFGSKWRLGGIHKYYIETFSRTVEGYNYGILMELNKGKVTLGWRTRNFGDNVSIQKVLESVGVIQAGGHFGAGGASFDTTDINEVKQKIIHEMEKALAEKENYK